MQSDQHAPPADAGETFALSAAPIWVRPYVAALQLVQPEVS